MTLAERPKIVAGVFYANLIYMFIDDNPEAGLVLQNPLIEIQGEKLTYDEAFKKMTYYLGDDEDKYELYRSGRKKAKDYIRKYSLFSQKKI